MPNNSRPAQVRHPAWYRWLAVPGLFLTTAGLGLVLLAGLALLLLAMPVRPVPAPGLTDAAAAPTIVFIVVPGPTVPSMLPAGVATEPNVLSMGHLLPLLEEHTAARPEPIPAAEIQELPLPSPAPQVLTYRRMFQEVAARYGLDWRLLAAQAYRESTLNPLAVGSNNDLGLMQILPSTWEEWAPQVGAADPFDAYSNTLVAAAYLTYLQEYLAGLGHTELYWVLVAYNWGPDRVRNLLAGSADWYQVPPLQRRYAADILEIAFGASPAGGTSFVP